MTMVLLSTRESQELMRAQTVGMRVGGKIQEDAQEQCWCPVGQDRNAYVAYARMLIACCCRLNFSA